MDYSDEMRRARERYESSPGYRPDPPARSAERRAADAERRRLRQEQDSALAELGRAFSAALAHVSPSRSRTKDEIMARALVEGCADRGPYFIRRLVRAMLSADRERREELGRAARLAALPSLTCPSCNRVFKGSRPGAKYCSGPCRQAGYRARRRLAYTVDRTARNQAVDRPSPSI